MKEYLKDLETIYKELNSSENGLNSVYVSNTLKTNGLNKLKENEKEPLIKKFINSLADPMIIMLIAAAAIQAIINVIQLNGKPNISDFADVIVILTVVLINTCMSLLQEAKAENAMETLQKMTASTSKVLRDGKIEVVKSEEIVIGDIVLLEAGDSVPADCRIIESHSLKTEESSLTGESIPVQKMSNLLELKSGKDDIPLGDRKNMVFSGSTVVYGRGKAIVTACGMDTEMGKIANVLSQAIKEQTPLQKKMSELSKVLTKVVLIICAIVFAVGIIKPLIDNNWTLSLDILGSLVIDTFVSAIALAVAAIPEGLPAVVTIILSIGVSQMAKQRAIIRKLNAVETLGCTTIICSDKTGTLTQNKMTIVDDYASHKGLLVKAMALCSDAEINPGEDYSTGEPTEAALVNYAHKLGYEKYKLKEIHNRLLEAPFDSERKMMSTIHNYENKYVQYTKGALDVLLSKCTTFLDNEKELPLTEEVRQKILNKNNEWTSKALRVLAVAYKDYDKLPVFENPAEIENNLTFIGMVGMIDPCRPEVYKAIEDCTSAGIKVVMITGDHIDTATAIGLDLGIISDHSEAIEGYELDKYSDEEMKEIVKKYSVYARVQPEHKTKIVKAWKSLGAVTAMTGDGVNDAPSIKTADIGIGMGITGTDVTKTAADMILADDNFATIVGAVKEGRKIFDNICKIIQFQLSTNLSEVIIMLVSSLAGFTILTPVHLLWINMITDSLPGLALGVEEADSEIMKRKPRKSTEGVFSNGAGKNMIWQGLMISIIELTSFLIGIKLATGSFNPSGIKNCSTAIIMAFITVNLSELFCAINLRSQNKSIFSKELIENQNKMLILASFVTVLLSIGILFIPGIKDIFGVPASGLKVNELLISIGLSLLIFPIFEVGKFVNKKLGTQNFS